MATLPSRRAATPAPRRSTITDTTITFGPLALTRKACPQPQMDLENAVVSVLGGEVSYTIDSSALQLRRTTDSGEIGLNLTAS